MTMPHLMNCAHSETGWCLDCVKEQWEELDRALAVANELRRRLYGNGSEYISNLNFHRVMRIEKLENALKQIAAMSLVDGIDAIPLAREALK